MKAIAYKGFGAPDVLQLEELPTPEVRPGEVLVRVRAVSPNPWDWHFMRGLPYIARVMAVGLLEPKHPVLGRDVAGEVVAIGEGVTRSDRATTSTVSSRRGASRSTSRLRRRCWRRSLAT